MNKKTFISAAMILVMLFSVFNIAFVFAKGEDTTEPPETEKVEVTTESLNEKTTEKTTEPKTEPKTEADTTEKITEPKTEADTTEKTTKKITPDKTTEKSTKKQDGAEKQTTTKKSGSANKYVYEEVEVGYYDEEDYQFVPSDKDYVIDLTQGQSLSQELGFYGPMVSNEEALSMTDDGMNFDTSVKDAYANIDFTSTTMEDYKYALIKIKSSDAKAPSNFSLKIGDVEKHFNEWELTNKTNPPAALSTDFKVYAIDLKANGVEKLLCLGESEDENSADEPDIAFINGKTGKTTVTVSYIIFTNEKPTYTKVTTQAAEKKESLAGKLVIPIILIVVSIAVLYYVNFVIFKTQKQNDRKVKRTANSYDDGYIGRK